LATIEAVRQANGDRPIVGIVGGLHLMNIQSDNYLLRIADCLRALNVPIIAVGHCTGERAEMFLDEHLPNRVRPIMTGDVMSFGASSQSC
jgi:metal-dependent hydrolase (beta-lactamase superfamily II)